MRADRVVSNAQRGGEFLDRARRPPEFSDNLTAGGRQETLVPAADGHVWSSPLVSSRAGVASIPRHACMVHSRAARRSALRQEYSNHTIYLTLCRTEFMLWVNARP